ncbi:hypothetical protein N431DRAFT_101845 [Stipitochalara longipes BDJ]|nr:hypothetical protein N431DRAFT_101845 [Stipitochalara longipes BDJ]
MRSTMPASTELLWVNKTRESTSLSNCRDEKYASRRIRSHAVTVGHKSSRVKRPIKRTPRDLKWALRKSPTSDWPLQQVRQKHNNNDPLPLEGALQHEYCNPRQLCSTSPLDSNLALHNKLTLHPLTTHPDPFSSYPIKLCPTTLENLHYFTHIWTHSSFKLRGCIGYNTPPIPQSTITTLLQNILTDSTRAYCLLAASSARRVYIHAHPSRNQTQAHSYAAHAIQGLQRRMRRSEGEGEGGGRKEWEEEDATDVLFLAAYEIFCEDEGGAEKHLSAVQRLYRREIENLWVRRLRVNLEILVARSVGRCS